MTRSQVSETLPEERQEERVKKFKNKIPANYIVHAQGMSEGKPVLHCYNPTEKDVTKAWCKVEI